MEIMSTYAVFDGEDASQNAIDAVRKIKEDFSSFKPAQVLFFSARNYHAGRLAAEMRDAFPGALTFGCSASGEISNGRMLKRSVAAMAFGKDVFDFFDMVSLPRLGPDSRPCDHARQVEEIFAGFAAKLGMESIMSLDYSKYVGIVFADGLRYFVEPVLERACDLTSVSFVGGIAGDDLQNRYTPVFLNGQVLPDSLIMGIARPRGKFSLLKTQGMDVLDKSFVITKATERVVHEFDGRPAASVYAEAIGVPESRLSMESAFSRWPIGVMVGAEPFLRLILDSRPDGSLIFSHAIREGMRVRMCQVAGIVESTAAALEKKRLELGGIGGIIHINCMLREMFLEQKGELDAFGDLFKDYRHIGFSSHGEIFVAIANITSTMLVLGEN